MRRTSFWIPVLLTMLLSACVSYVPLQRPQTAKISRGADQVQIDRLLGKATVLASHTFRANGQLYLAKHYDIKTGTRPELIMRCYRRRGCISSYYDMPVIESYVIVYEQPSGKVFAWGMVEELSRSPDDAVSSIMPALKASYQAGRKR